MTRETFLHFHQPDLDGDELAAIEEVLDSGWLTTGEKVQAFEEAFAAFVGVEQAVAVNSCTAAMHLALEAIGLKAGDRVITSPYTFAATAEVVHYFDAVPVFVDVEPKTLNIDPDHLIGVMDKIPPGTARALIPVHIAGHPCEMGVIEAIAEGHGLVVIEDAAHALPARYRGRMIGGSKKKEETSRLMSAPGMTCFSFYATKTLTTGEGGMITTENEDWAERCRVMSNHGISKDSYKRYTAEGSWHYDVVAPGFKYNMTDLAAAMGLVQLGKANRMWQRRVQIASQYTEAFCSYTELEPPSVAPGVQHAWHLYILRLQPDMLEINRDRFIEELKRRKVGTSVHFIPLHLHRYYVETYGYQPDDFPVAYEQYQRVISLPICSPMTGKDVSDVIRAVSEIVEENRTHKVYKVGVPEGHRLKDETGF